jgi:hypothetical protein
MDSLCLDGLVTFVVRGNRKLGSLRKRYPPPLKFLYLLCKDSGLWCSMPFS